LHIVDSTTLNVSKSSRLGKAPYSPSLDTKRRRVFVANTYDQSISVASYGSLDGDMVIPVGKGPSAIQVSERHGKAFVHVYARGLLIIDTGSCEIEMVIPPSVAYGAGESGIRWENTAIDEEANVLLFAGRSKGADDGFLSVMDMDSRQIQFRLPAGQAPSGVAIDRVLHRAYVLNIGTYDSGGYRMTVGFGRVGVFNYATSSYEGEIALGKKPDAGRYAEDVDIGRNPVTIVVDESSHRVLVLNSARSVLSVIQEAEM
jgi:DNA-binding beta-propeller fold protein YncE